MDVSESAGGSIAGEGLKSGGNPRGEPASDAGDGGIPGEYRGDENPGSVSGESASGGSDSGLTERYCGKRGASSLVSGDGAKGLASSCSDRVAAARESTAASRTKVGNFPWFFMVDSIDRSRDAS
ncbi:hypothetical protein SAY86_021328 [Trapa natans]|uniref:Uncharacterized protein n=1 Tax=Trapa natans TaxID=22666 RepID=A0AAN7MTY8_TRANT|nr:hypothetical protein SAY86_021328 [Trapa natans]